MDRTVILKKQNLGPLHELFLNLCPPNEEGVKSIAVLASLLGTDAQFLYVLIRNKRQIPLKFAKRLVTLSEGRTTVGELQEKGFVSREPSKLTKRRLGPVQELLLKACPPDSDGIVSVSRIARKLGISSQSVYRFCRLNIIPAKRAQQIVDVSEGRIALDELLPFVLGR